MRFNINEHVRVRLTPEGKAAHAADHVEFCAKSGLHYPYAAPVEDVDGWSKWQLWDLMKSFGHHLYMGGPTMFETEIDIPLPAPQPE